MRSTKQKLTSEIQPSLFRVLDAPLPGSFNIDAQVRAVVTAAIKRCPKKRQQIAEEMTDLLAVQVTERMLNAWTADSQEQHRFPLAYAPAFCQVVGNFDVFVVALRSAGVRVITEEQAALLDFGQSSLRRELVDREYSSRLAQLMSGKDAL